MEEKSDIEFKITDTTYNLVVEFHNNEAYYSPNEDLVCQFSFKDFFSVDDLSDCSVCLFKVGWESCQGYVAKKTLDQCNIFGNNQNADNQFKMSEVHEVTFTCNELPRDDQECYQFCFLWQTSVLGASQPFQFQDGESSGTEASDIEIVKEGDLEWFYEMSAKQLPAGEIMDETVLVHNERTVLEDTLARVMEENAILKEWKKSAADEISEFRGNAVELEAHKVQLEKIILDKTKQIEKDDQMATELKTKLRDTERKANTAAESSLRLQKRILSLEKQLADSDEEVKVLLSKKEAEKGAEKEKAIKVYELKLANSTRLMQQIEKDLLEEKVAKDQLQSKYYKDREDYETQLQDLYQQVKGSKQLVEEISIEKEELVSQVLEEKTRYGECVRENEEAIKIYEARISELQELNENLCASSEKSISELEQKVVSANKQINALEKERDHFKMISIQQEEGSETIAILQSKLASELENEKQLAERLKQVEDELNSEKQAYASLKENFEKSNGAHHALKVAYAHVQKKNIVIKAEKEEATRLFQSLQKQLGGTPSSAIIEELNKEIEDLKLRLCMGLNAYKEKFLECRKLQKRIEKTDKTQTLASELADATRNMPSMECWRSSSNLSYTSLMSAPDVTDVGNKVASLKMDISRDDFELLKSKNTKLQREVVSLQEEIKQLQTQLANTTAALNQQTSQGRYSSTEEDQDIKTALTKEVKRLEDVVHLKDAEIRNLKDENLELRDFTDGQPPDVRGLVDLRDQHKKKFEKLQKECEKYKQILIGVRKVTGQQIRTGDDAKDMKESLTVAEGDSQSPPTNKWDESLSPQSFTVPVPCSSYGRPNPSAETAVVLSEPHMRPMRDPATHPQENSFAFSQATSSQKEFKRPSPSEPMINLCYPSIYGSPEQPPSSRTTATARPQQAWDTFRPLERSSRVLMEPAIRCPVCQEEFPPGFSDLSATEHVNAHFDAK